MSNKDGAGNDSEDDATQKVEIVTNAETTETEFSLRERLLDIYGSCLRDLPKRNDCYWGKDGAGRYDGCLKIGWRGRACPHWTPAPREQIAQIMEAHRSCRQLVRVSETTFGE